MNHSARLLRLALIAIAASPLAVCATEPVEKEQARIDVELTIPQEPIALGAPIPVKVTYRNPTRKPLRVLGRTDWGKPTVFEVRDSSGLPSVTITAPRQEHAANPTGFVDVPPQQTLERTFDLSTFFRFERPDTYTVTAHYTPFYGLPAADSPPAILRLTDEGPPAP